MFFFSISKINQLKLISVGMMLRPTRMEITDMHQRPLIVLQRPSRLVSHLISYQKNVETPMLSKLLFSWIKAFWNRWTMDLDFGPGNAGLWTEISTKKHTQFAAINPEQFLCVFGLESRSRVQHFRVQSPGPGPSNSKMP